MHLMDTLKSWKEPLVEELAEKLGAKCKLLAPKFPHSSELNLQQIKDLPESGTPSTLPMAD
jgi:hypothetical protein